MNLNLLNDFIREFSAVMRGAFICIFSSYIKNVMQESGPPLFCRLDVDIILIA